MASIFLLDKSAYAISMASSNEIAGFSGIMLRPLLSVGEVVGAGAGGGCSGAGA